MVGRKGIMQTLCYRLNSNLFRFLRSKLPIKPSNRIKLCQTSEQLPRPDISPFSSVTIPYHVKRERERVRWKLTTAASSPNSLDSSFRASSFFESAKNSIASQAGSCAFVLTEGSLGGMEEGVLSARGVTKGTTVDKGIERRVRTL